MAKFNRIIIVVLDGLGVGELPDSEDYGDKGSNTLSNIAQAIGGLHLPTLERLGLGNIIEIKGIKPTSFPTASFGKMAEQSAGKDTTTGHWEIAGLVNPQPFPTYPLGFPDEIIVPFQKAIGKKVLGNKPASGTEIIKELGEEHIATGYPIVYTSADSVFQIAAHEEIIPVEKLYHMCSVARTLLKGKHAVSRVIARPFVGKPANFSRTERRKDFSLPPTGKTLLDNALEAGLEVIGIGKIEDIFAGQGISKAIHTKNNYQGMIETIQATKNAFKGIIFTNLVDFDMLYGHRNNPLGFAQALKELDSLLPQLIDNLREDDILFLTADHGCDPTTASTDHSREYVPLLVVGKKIKKGINLGIRESFADIGATAAEALNIKKTQYGKSFLPTLLLQ